MKDKPVSVDNQTEYILPFSNSQFLKVSRKSETPIIDFRISYNGLPCYEAGRHPSGSIPPFPLLKTEFSCGMYGEDENANFLDKKGEFEVYTFNNIKPTIAQIPGYLAAIGDRQMVLSYITKVETNPRNPNCLPSEVDNNDKNPDFYQISAIVYGIFIILFMAIELIVFMLTSFSVCVLTLNVDQD